MKIGGKKYTSDFYIWYGTSAFITSGMNTPFHAHSTIQIVIDLEDYFKLESQAGISRKCNSAIIKPDTFHKLNSLKGTQLILYIEKTSSMGKRLLTNHLKAEEIIFPEFKIKQTHISELLRSAIIQQDGISLYKQVQLILNVLLGTKENIKIKDKRIAKIRALIDSSPPADLTIESLAQNIHLSASRMRHLFKEQVGISIKQYILWRKIIYSIHLILNGRSLSEAAWESGFTDLSHYNKMMIKMFGIVPSHIIKNNKGFKQRPSGKDIFKIRTEVLDTGKLIGHKF